MSISKPPSPATDQFGSLSWKKRESMQEGVCAQVLSSHDGENLGLGHTVSPPSPELTALTHFSVSA